MMWDVFKRLFKENYFNADHRQSIADEFESFYQDSMIVTNFYNRFIELAQYAQVGGYPSTDSEVQKAALSCHLRKISWSPFH